MLYLPPVGPVTTVEIIVIALTVLPMLCGAGLFIAKVSRAMGVASTEFRLGISSLTSAMNKLSTAVDNGFVAVHERLDRGEAKMGVMSDRIMRLEIKNGIDPDIGDR